MENNQNQKYFTVKVYPLFKGFKEKDRTDAAVELLFGKYAAGDYDRMRPYFGAKQSTMGWYKYEDRPDKYIIGIGKITDVIEDENKNMYFEIEVRKNIEEIIAKMNDPRMLCTCKCVKLQDDNGEYYWYAYEPIFTLVEMADVIQSEKDKIEERNREIAAKLNKHVKSMPTYAIGGSLATDDVQQEEVEREDHEDREVVREDREDHSEDTGKSEEPVQPGEYHEADLTKVTKTFTV